MRSQRWRRVVVIAIILGMVALVLASLATPSRAQDLDQVRRDRVALQQRLDAAAAQLSELESLTAVVEQKREDLARQVTSVEGEIAAADQRVIERVRELYKRGQEMNPLMVFLDAEGAQDALDRAAVLQRLARGDQAAGEIAVAGRAKLLALGRRIDEENAELDALVLRQRDLFAQLQVDLDAAEELENRLVEQAAARARAERDRAAAAAAAREAQRQTAIRSTGGTACPLANPRSFSNDWGQPRSGGRSHRGTDIIGRLGAPVYAIVGGTVDIKRYGNSAGNWLILKGVDGTSYWYLHLDGFNVGNGARVTAGQQIATNGMTGNARGTVPHIHFEMHPGGGGAINPYTTVKRACG